MGLPLRADAAIVTAASPWTVAFDLPVAPPGYPLMGTEALHFGCTVAPCASDWEGDLEHGHTSHPPDGITVHLGSQSGLRDLGAFTEGGFDYARDGMGFWWGTILFPEGMRTLHVTFLLTGHHFPHTFYRVDHVWLDVRWGDGDGWWGGTEVVFGNPPATPPVSPVPLPAGLWLMLAGCGGLGLARRGRRA